MSVGSTWSPEIDALFSVASARNLHVELYVGDYTGGYNGRRPFRMWRLVEQPKGARPHVSRLVAQQPIWRDDAHALRAAATVMLKDLAA